MQGKLKLPGLHILFSHIRSREDSLGIRNQSPKKLCCAIMQVKGKGKLKFEHKNFKAPDFPVALKPLMNRQ